MATEFEKQFELLNSQQKKAVQSIEGPLLVVAGPGTGKTQLLSMRIANILKETDASPSSILGLTFTNKAAINMKDRLQGLTGSEASGVTLKTFHSFAGEIMSMYPEYFWSGARLIAAPEGVQLEIIQSILAKLPLANPLALKFSGKYTAISDVQSSLKLAKEAGLTPKKLQALIEANIAYIDLIENDLADILKAPLSVKNIDAVANKINALPNQPINQTVFPLISLTTVIKESLATAVKKDEGTNKTKHTGDFKKRWIQTVGGQTRMFNEHRRNEWWLALSQVYGFYRKELHERGYYDYSDMLVEVITQLEKHPDMLAGVQERFLYVLIDEFQDTNAAQLRLAHLISAHHTASGKPNLMAVGDDDQSIYKFNGAELNNMLSFRRMYPDANLIVLEKNYRSTQDILDTAKRIIDQAEDRLVKREPEITKNILAAKKFTEKGEITHLSYPSKEHQLSGIARQIQKSYNTETSIAVLARGHESLRQMASMLLKLNLPVRYEQQSNILEHEAVKQALILSELAASIGNGNKQLTSKLISQTLRHPMWHIDPELLWQIAVDNYGKHEWLDSLLNHPEERLRNIGKFFLWLADEAEYQPLTVVLEYILGLREGKYLTSPLKEFYERKHAESTDYLHTLSAIHLLRALAHEFSISREASITDFVQFINLHQANERSVTDETPFVTNTHAVQLLTVHKAKGLEFDEVYIIDAVEKTWQPRVGGRKPPANLPLQPHGDDMDDYVRLMYVAATRAKHTLIASSYRNDHLGREILATPLIRNSISNIKIIEKPKHHETITALEESLSWPRLPAKNEKAMLRERLDGYSLNITHLLNFLDVSKGGPQYFLQRHLLRLPEVKSPHGAQGTAIHAALELAQKLVNKDKFDLPKVLKEYKRVLKREGLNVQDTERYLEHGQALLQKIFNEYDFKLLKGSLPEQRLADVSLGKATLSGILDRIDFNGKDKITITDYKTGKALKNFNTKNQALAYRAWKNKSQLAFYTILARESSRFNNYRKIDAQMIYLQAESVQELVRLYTPSTEEIDRMDKIISVIWGKIMDLDFPDVSQYSPDIKGIKAFEEDLIEKAT